MLLWLFVEPRMRSLIVFLIATSLAGAQQASGPAANVQPNIPTVVWLPDHPGWDQVLVDGVWYRTAYDSSGIGIQATVGTLSHYSAALVTIFNHRLTRIEVSPESAYLYELQPKKRRFNQIDVGRVEKSIGSRSAIRAGFVGALGGIASQRTVSQSGSFDGNYSGFDNNGQWDHGTVSGTYNGTATVFDPEAARRASEAAAAVRGQGTSLQGLVAANALRPNTLMPGQSMRGLIFFERATEKEGTALIMIVGTTRFILPFWFKYIITVPLILRLALKM